MMGMYLSELLRCQAALSDRAAPQQYTGTLQHTDAAQGQDHIMNSLGSAPPPLVHTSGITRSQRVAGSLGRHP